MTAAATTVTGAGVAAPAGWLRHRAFDLTFIVGVAVLALAAGVAAIVEPRLFPVLLALDLWLLGYHHVVSTFTRLCFDRRSLREHSFLVFGLPPIVLVGVLTLVLAGGVWAVATLFFYWQWFHYTRQSFGVAKVYAKKSDTRLPDDARLTTCVLYATPLFGILQRSHEDPTRFLGLPLVALPVPALLVELSMAFAVAVLAVWLSRRAIAWYRGQLPVAHTLYVMSHVVVFVVGYALIRDVTHGWLVLNVWHNAQYVLFVWLFNNGRFRKGQSNEAPFLSRLSQPGNVWLYFGVCLALSSSLYLGIQSLIPAAFLLVVYQTLNFHHYLVDGLIWKVRRPALRSTLGLSRAS